MLKASAALLDLQEAALNRLKACARNAKQPICSIPDEIIANIFETVTPSLHTSWLHDPVNKKDAPWTVSEYNTTLQRVIMTCSRLRSSILKAPRCWRFVVCNPGSEGTTLEALSIMLARSKNCLFNLALLLRSESFGSSSYALQAFSDVLLPHMSRCESLSITSDHRGAEIPRLIPRNPLQALRHVTFNWSTDENADEEEQNFDGKAEAVMLSIIGGIELPLVSLRVVGATKVNQALKGDFGSIQAQAFTRLRIEVACPVREVVNLLQNCSNLEHLLWKVDDDDDDEEDLETAPVMLTLDKLISLQIIGGHSGGCGIFLAAANLEQADFSCYDNLLPFDITHPNHPRLPSLTRLCVAMLNAPSERMASFLHSHPDVTECFIYDESPEQESDVQQHAMYLCAAVESFLAPTDGVIHSRLRHLSVQIDWNYFTLIRDQLTASLQLVLHMLDRVHIDMHIGMSGEVRESETLEMTKGKHASRVSVDPPDERIDTWPQAWLKEKW